MTGVSELAVGATDDVEGGRALAHVHKPTQTDRDGLTTSQFLRYATATDHVRTVVIWLIMI